MSRCNVAYLPKSKTHTNPAAILYYRSPLTIVRTLLAFLKEARNTMIRTSPLVAICKHDPSPLQASDPKTPASQHNDE